MIEINAVTKHFGNKVIFTDFSEKIEDGEFVVITGKSGCGKTTLLNLIGGLESLDKGNILIDGLNISKRKNRVICYREKFGFLFQNFALIENRTLRQNFDVIDKHARSEMKIEEALEIVGLKESLDSEVYQLSGGEQQRAAVARLMLKKCSIILADEPTASLDRDNAVVIIGLLQRLNKEGKTIIMVTHDMRIAEVGSRIISL